MAAEAAHPIEKIVVRAQVGHHRMAASDDPFFLRLIGPGGREFRLLLAKGKTLRRDAQDVYVLGAAQAPETNIANPALNDPTSPQLHLGDVERVAVHKSTDPIPNVRGVGELDDRLELEAIEVEIHASGLSEPRRYRRSGPLWLGLACGLSVELPHVDDEG